MTESTAKIKIGSRIRMFAIPEENILESIGVIDFIDKQYNTLIVTVDKKYRSSSFEDFDDGIREIAFNSKDYEILMI